MDLQSYQDTLLGTASTRHGDLPLVVSVLGLVGSAGAVHSYLGVRDNQNFVVNLARVLFGTISLLNALDLKIKPFIGGIYKQPSPLMNPKAIATILLLRCASLANILEDSVDKETTLDMISIKRHIQHILVCIYQLGLEYDYTPNQLADLSLSTLDQ